MMDNKDTGKAAFIRHNGAVEDAVRHFQMIPQNDGIF